MRQNNTNRNVVKAIHVKEKRKKSRTLFSKKQVPQVSATPPVIPPPFHPLLGNLQDPNQQDRAFYLKEEIFKWLQYAMVTKNVASPQAQWTAHLHRQWICLFWKEGMYTKQSHLRLADIYVAEPRFGQWYDCRVGQGGAKFLRDAIEIYMFRAILPEKPPTPLSSPSSPTLPPVKNVLPP